MGERGLGGLADRNGHDFHLGNLQDPSTLPSTPVKPKLSNVTVRISLSLSLLDYSTCRNEYMHVRCRTTYIHFSGFGSLIDSGKSVQGQEAHERQSLTWPQRVART